MGHLRISEREALFVRLRVCNGVCLAYTSDHEGKGVQLRFALRDASLYSFWFEVPKE